MARIYPNNASATYISDAGMSKNDNLAVAILKIPVQFFKMLLVWQERATTRAGLRELDARFLADVGLSKQEAYIESRKPFWLK